MEHIDRQEADAFLWMQGRMVELLMRHDVPRFEKTFGEHSASSVEDERLQHYRERAVVFYLRNELFDNILPRIKRRLSFAAPRELHVEQLPPRGRIDWHRTTSATFSDRPGEPPLEVHTRQRRRHFATPENVLTVATILEYEEAVQRLLDQEAVRDRKQAMRHPLQAIIDSCHRELAFPQFAGLLRDAQKLLKEQSSQSLADFERRVARNLLPGRNSAYDDLLSWRSKLATLQMLSDDRLPSSQQMLGADPEEVDYLYQAWLFYEIVDLLQHLGHLRDWNAATQTVMFDWGDEAQRRSYTLRHDRKIPHHWEGAPGVRPDFYIAHTNRAEVREGNDIIWHESGFVLDAKYYKPRDTSRAPASTIKRMIADLRLTGEQHGALIFAFQRGEPRAAPQTAPVGLDEYEPDTSANPAQLEPLYRVQPQSSAAQRGAPDESVAIWRVRPQFEAVDSTRALLVKILDDAHTALCHRRIPACHGIFLDTLSATQHEAADRWGAALDTRAGDLLICPKPHIGPWRVDIVSRKLHCCADPRLCHILGQPGVKRPVRPPRDARDLVEELKQIFEGDAKKQLSEDEVSAIAGTVEGLTRHFAERLGVFRNISVYENRLRDMGMARTLDKLGKSERESLALALFLVEQLDSIGAQDFSAPAIHISSVQELEIQRRVFLCPGLVSQAAFPKKQTLGLLPFMRWKPHETQGDWDRILAFATERWDGHVIPDDPSANIEFPTFVKTIDSIAQIRNKAAHPHPVTREDYRSLFNLTCQGGPLRIGALNVLLLAWQD